MNLVCNSPKDLSVYSEFICLLDDSLTLIESNPKLATLLGCTSSQLPATLLSGMQSDSPNERDVKRAQILQEALQ